MTKQLKYDFSIDLNKLKNLQMNQSVAFLTINTKNSKKSCDKYHKTNKLIN